MVKHYYGTKKIFGKKTVIGQKYLVNTIMGQRNSGITQSWVKKSNAVKNYDGTKKDAVKHFYETKHLRKNTIIGLNI